MVKCVVSDYIALTKGIEFGKECHARLFENGFIDAEGNSTEKAKPVIQKMLDAERHLQRGIRIDKRTKTDPNAILDTGFQWTSQSFPSKNITLTINPCFSYFGRPIKGLIIDKKYKPDKNSILSKLDIPKDAKCAKPIYYQQTALDGIKLIWFKYNSEGFLAIQACYYDFLINKFKEVKWYCSNLSSLVYATKGKNLCGMVMPYDTTNVIERPTI